MTPDPIVYLARRCAHAGLSLRDARYLFEAIYMADALMLAGGNQTEAAKIAGQQRTSHLLRRRKHEHTMEKD